MTDRDRQDVPPTGSDAPLHEIKANLFKALAHPIRIRVLEVLTADPTLPRDLSDLSEETGFDLETLSQHLSVLRRHGAVVAQPTQVGARYQVAHDRIGELLVVAKSFLRDTSSPEEPPAPRRTHLSSVPDLPDQPS
ncbi:MAG: helix-turn-helix domain-containing protein [Aeromicrobium erythreum]